MFGGSMYQRYTATSRRRRPSFPAVALLVAVSRSRVWTAVPVASVTFLAAALTPDRSAGGEVERVAPRELIERAAGVPDRAPLGRASFAAGGAAALMPWTPLGPDHVEGVRNPGESATYVAAGRVNALVVDSREGDVAYAASQGGVWKTRDGGATWTPLTDALSSLSSGALALDPRNPDVVYYGTGEQNFCGDCLYGDGLFRSADGGATWSKIGAKADVGSYIARVMVRPDSTQVVFVGSERGVVRSADGGTTWQTMLADGWCTDMAIDPRAPSILYAAIDNRGVYKSQDGGATWTKLASGLPATHFSRINMALAPSNPATLYASFVDVAAGNLLGMYRTDDGGASWTHLANTPDYLISTVGAPAGQGWFDNCLVVDPTDAEVCYAGGAYPTSHANALIKTTDGGATWTGVAIGVDGVTTHNDHHALAFGPDGRLWNGNDGGVWTSTDGGLHWLNRNATLAVTQFYTIAHHPSDTSLLVGGTQDQGTVSLTGGTWTQRITTDGGPCLVDPVLPLAFYGTTREMRSLEYVTEDGAVDLTGEWASAGDRASFAKGPLVRDPEDSGELYLGTYRVWKSVDAGLTWVPASGDLSRTPWGVLLAIGLGAGAPHAVYAATDDGSLWLSTDDAPAWTLRTTGLPPAPLSAIAVSPAAWQTAFVTANVTIGDRVFRTDDAGVTWTSVTGDLVSGVRPIAMTASFTTNPPAVYLGTDFGVYTSFDGGAHWEKTSLGLPSLAVYALSLDEPHMRLIAATHGRGVWSSPLPVALDVPHDSTSSDASRNAPSLRAVANPRTSRIEVRYELPAPSVAVLEMFTPDGRRVATLSLGWQEAGSHRSTWDARAAGDRPLAAGLYLLRLCAGVTHVAARLVVMR
jgi:photosystem II stability/assembly factor-like uncharacterized protein